MSDKKVKCPICFTKMHQSDHSLVCPECGYRYCDHNYDNRDHYGAGHTHTPQYTTASAKATYQTQNTQPKSAQSSQNTHPGYTSNTADTQPQQYTQVAPAYRPAASSREQQSKQTKSVISIIRTIIIIYVLFVFASTILPIIAAALFGFF